MQKVVVITGASSGLGKELAKLYLKKSTYQLLLTGRNEKGFDEFETNSRVEIVIGDLTQRKTLDEIEKKVTEKFGRVDILINNAGIIYLQPFEKNTEEQINKLISINLIAPMLLTQRLYPIMTAQQSGHIVNINSTAGKESKENHTLYCAAKWGLTGFTNALRKEAKKYNIRISSIHPGGIKTALYDELETKINTETFMDAKKVAEIILFLTQTEGLAPDEIVINRMS